jgi:hypothetical protein
MQLHVIGGVNVAAGQHFIAHMVDLDYRDRHCTRYCLLYYLSQANEVGIEFLFVCLQESLSTSLDSSLKEYL